MKKKPEAPKTQPKLSTVTISCACGHSIQVSTAAPAYTVEICSHCHPFFTGKQKFIDAAGKIDKFNRKYEKFIKPAKAASSAA